MGNATFGIYYKTFLSRSHSHNAERGEDRREKECEKSSSASRVSIEIGTTKKSDIENYFCGPESEPERVCRVKPAVGSHNSYFE